MAQRTLIFGATGYIGRHVAARLAAAGDAVTGFARDAAGAAKVTAAGATPVVGTLDDAAGIAALIDAHDRIVWAAQLMLQPEHEVVTGLLRRLAGSSKAFVFTSGTGVLSERTDGDWSEASFAEDDAFVPRAALALRVATEDLVRAAAMDGLRAIVIRPPTIWGNGGAPIVAEIYRSVARTGAACYLGRGLNCYSNVHVEDLADLYALALAKAPAGALYHAVSGELNFRGFAEGVARHLGIATRSLDPAQAREVFGASATGLLFAASSRSRSPRARGELGWAPRADRLDVYSECAHPAFADAADRGPASWTAEAERSAASR